MQQYFYEGFYYLKGSIMLAVIVYALYAVYLAVTNKRDFRNIHLFSKTKMIAEFLMVLYVCTILKITGILQMSIEFQFQNGFVNFISIPFLGASIKMIILNVLLFVPYGFLFSYVFNSSRLNWKSALMVGFLSSFCIELLQLFGGRFCEIDDLIANTSGFVIGYLLLRSFQMIYDKESRKKGIIQVICIFMITSVTFFALSFIANGDALQKQMDEYYKEIGNHEDTSKIIEFKVYKGDQIIDGLKTEIDYEMLYRSIGMDIGNTAGKYQVSNEETDMDEILKQEKGTYIEIVYNDSNIFRFYNNQEWTMEDVVHIVYCVDDGTLWYGSSKNSLEYCAQYMNKEVFRDKDIQNKIEEIFN